ncbi:13835_t:CDS:1, partial [Cetraspora pellucida]
DITSDFLPPCFNTYELTLPYYSYEHNIANVSSFYPNAYEYYDNVNTSLSPYPSPYGYDSAMSTYVNFQSSSDSLTKSDIEAQPEGADNGIYDERENNEHEDSENAKEGKNNLLVLHKGMKFSIWELAELYLINYAKQEGFSFRKRRQFVDSNDYTITRWRTYECSHAQIHEPEKAILAEDRRDRDSEMIDCSWPINLAFPKMEKEVRINSILGEHNHKMNTLVTEMAPKYQKLPYKMSEKVKFWTIQGKLGLPTQYNLLVASFSGQVINKKDLSNAIQQFKSQ